MKRILTSAIALAALGLVSAEAQTTLADWTFETSLPTGTGPYAPELGTETGSAQASASGLGTITNPAGDGSSHSFSANGWTVGGYYQFSLNTVGYQDIQISYDQTSSNTGPRDFSFEYSVDGGNSFNVIDNSSGTDPYEVLPNASVDGNSAWNATTFQSAFQFTVDLSSITLADDASSLIFRLVDDDTTAANSGSPVAVAGTDRVDNFDVTATPVPEPSTVALAAMSGLTYLAGMRRFLGRTKRG